MRLHVDGARTGGGADRNNIRVYSRAVLGIGFFSPSSARPVFTLFFTSSATRKKKTNCISEKKLPSKSPVHTFRADAKGVARWKAKMHVVKEY